MYKPIVSLVVKDVEEIDWADLGMDAYLIETNIRENVSGIFGEILIIADKDTTETLKSILKCEPLYRLERWCDNQILYGFIIKEK